MTRLLSAVLLIVAVAWSQNNVAQDSGSLDGKFADLNAEISAGDYRAASFAISELHKRIGAAKVPVDFAAIHSQSNGSIESSVASQHIQSAQDKYHAGDVTGAAHELDDARGVLTKLYLNATPQSRLNFARLTVEKEASQFGEAKPWSLKDAAIQAYKAGYLADSIAYAERTLKASEGKREYGLLQHQTHIVLGLDYAAQGDDQHAAQELSNSLAVPHDAAFNQVGPSMALAKQLAVAQKSAVLAYLEACAKLNWQDKDKAIAWKASLEGGQLPDFGVQAKLP